MGLISTSDFNTRFDLSYARCGIDMNTHESYRWVGYAELKAGASYQTLDVITPSRQKGKADIPNMIIPANSFISQISFKPIDALTFTAPGGKLKLASAITTVAAGLFTESIAATAGTLAKRDLEYAVQNNTGVSVGVSDLALKLFATDGTTIASTVSGPAGKSTRVLVMVSFRKFCRFPTETEISALANYDVGN